MTSKKAPLLLVTWVDSCSPRRWTAREDLETGYSPTTVESIGWRVCEDAKSLTIAAHVTPEQYDGIMCIPKVAITSRKTLADGLSGNSGMTP